MGKGAAVHPGGAGPVRARAYANIALAKYWGKADRARNLPAVPSLSATLDGLWTEATVEVRPELEADVVSVAGAPPEPAVAERVSAFLDHLRRREGRARHARVATRSNFPMAAGLASSASAFAALALAGSEAWGLGLTRAQQSALARLGSGSAARSVFGGYVELPAAGPQPEEVAARPVCSAQRFPLGAVVVMAASDRKAVSSRAAMIRTAETAPYYGSWVESAPADVAAIRSALLSGDFDQVAAVAEHNCLKMHGLMLTARPPLRYWNAGTLAAMDRVAELRRADVRAFFTIDAGPNVVVFFAPEEVEPVMTALSSLDLPLRRMAVGGEPRVGAAD
jgi:diphosphomevalonate decarboxylase